MKVKTWVEKWSQKNILDQKWKSYIQTECSISGKMYGLIKTHKNDNPARIITSACNTAIESLSIFVEKVLYDIASNLPSRIKDTGHMLDIIDEINNSSLPTNSILVGFDIGNMFPSIDNKSGLTSVHDILELRYSKFPPTSCVIEATELCLSCNNSVFNNTNYLQTDSTAQGPHMSCSYADLALPSYDSKAPAKIQFPMQVTGDDGLEFLDLELKMVNGKISVEVFSKPTNSFTYVLPSTCYPNRNIKNVPKGIALRLRRICDSYEKYDERSEEYQKYLIARDYQPGSVKRQFEEVKKLSRSKARRPKVKSNQVRKLNFFTTCNPSLPNMDTLVKKYLPLLHSDENLKELFPASAFNTIYRRNKNRKELLSPSLFPNWKSTKNNSIISCNSCDICNIIWFLKTCLLVQLLVRSTSLKVSYTATPVMLYI